MRFSDKAPARAKLLNRSEVIRANPISEAEHKTHFKTREGQEQPKIMIVPPRVKSPRRTRKPSAIARSCTRNFGAGVMHAGSIFPRMESTSRKGFGNIGAGIGRETGPLSGEHVTAGITIGGGQ